jgi:isoleucyl-tRNA synthetase
MSLGSAGYASVMKIDIDQVCGTEISGIGRTAITVIGVLLGGPIVGIIAHVVTGLINENSKNKRKEAELKMRQQLSSNVFPQIDREIRDKVETDLNHVALEMRKTVEKNVGMQVDALKKSLDEVIAKKQTEDENKEQKRIEIENDIQLLQEAEYGIE